MKIAVIGGGVNGIMTGWALAQQGHEVSLFDRQGIMNATSANSTKLLHGGLRYLEHGQIKLVREALRERIWWIENAPNLAHRLEFVLPICKWSRRSRWKIGIGLHLYDSLSGKFNLGKHKWHSRDEIIRLAPELKSEDLVGGFTYFDGQMDDRQLGLWAADRAREAGVSFLEDASVSRVSPDGEVVVEGVTRKFDYVVNVAGPWAAQLLKDSGVSSGYGLDHVRGSHIFIRQPISRAYLIEVPNDERICFALPYLGRTMVGTTEVRQALNEPIRCSDEERDYLLKTWNSAFREEATTADLTGTFAGVRPLIRSHANPSRASREYAIEQQGRLITVFGGKWTTARVLGQTVAAMIPKNGAV